MLISSPSIFSSIACPGLNLYQVPLMIQRGSLFLLGRRTLEAVLPLLWPHLHTYDACVLFFVVFFALVVSMSVVHESILSYGGNTVHMCSSFGLWSSLNFVGDVFFSHLLLGRRTIYHFNQSCSLSD